MLIDGVAVGGSNAIRDFFVTPQVFEIDIGLPVPPLPVWLTAHEAMRQTPRIRRVWDMLCAGLKPLLS